MNQLQEQGEEILKKLQLLDKLSPFGEVHLVGNMAFETTIKPDIDLQIYPNDRFELTADKIKETLEKLGISKVIIRKLRISKKTLILGKFSSQGLIWNVDIALTNKNNDYIYDSYQYYLDSKDKMTPEKRELIIEFKKEFCNNKIVFDNPSFYIYRGVIENNIQTTKEMATYLAEAREIMKKGKSL